MVIAYLFGVDWFACLGFLFKDFLGGWEAAPELGCGVIWWKSCMLLVEIMNMKWMRWNGLY